MKMLKRICYKKDMLQTVCLGSELFQNWEHIVRCSKKRADALLGKVKRNVSILTGFGKCDNFVGKKIRAEV